MTSAFVTTGMIQRGIDEYRCRTSYYHFFRKAWSEVLEPDTPLVENWHLRAKCDHLQAVSRGEINRLIISEPPGFAKSMAASAAWHPWEWLDRPGRRFLCGSYEDGLVYRDANKARDVIKSDWYRDTFNPTWRIKRNEDAAGYFVNTRNGSRKGFWFGGQVAIGWRGDTLVVDDSMSAKKTYDIPAKQGVWETYTKTLMNRVNDLRTAAYVIIAQRLADDDLIGRIMELFPGAYTVLSLPAEHEPGARCRTSVVVDYAIFEDPGVFTVDEDGPDLRPFEDPRTEEGELLFPQKFPRDELDKFKLALGPDDYAAQYQQRPVRAGGARFRKEDFRYWTRVRVGGELSPLIELPRKDGRTSLVRLDQCWSFVSGDFAASEKNRADWTVFLEWAVTPQNDMVLTSMFRERVQEPDLIEQALAMQSKKNHAGGRHSAWVVDEGGLGLPIRQNMQARGIPVIGVYCNKDKYVRSVTASVRVRAGSVYFPQREETLQGNGKCWLDSLEEELVKFPLWSHDDIVDALSVGAAGLFDGLLGTITDSAPVVKKQEAAVDKVEPAVRLREAMRGGGSRRQRMGMG